MTPATLDAARSAKRKLMERFRDVNGVRGIGLAILDDGYGVKVNFVAPPPAGLVPDDVDGVPVIVDVVGPARPL